MSKSKVAEAVGVPVKTKSRVKGVSKDASLTVNVESNPKRAGSKSFDRFEGYLTDPRPSTVQEALDNGLTMGDIHYDIIAGSISVDGAEVEEYIPTSRGTKAGTKADTEAETVEAEGTEEQF